MIVSRPPPQSSTVVPRGRRVGSTASGDGSAGGTRARWREEGASTSSRFPPKSDIVARGLRLGAGRGDGGASNCSCCRLGCEASTSPREPPQSASGTARRRPDIADPTASISSATPPKLKIVRGCTGGKAVSSDIGSGVGFFVHGRNAPGVNPSALCNWSTLQRVHDTQTSTVLVQ